MLCFRGFAQDVLRLGERSSAGTAGAAVSVETGWRVKVAESVADRAAPAVVQPRLVRLPIGGDGSHVVGEVWQSRSQISRGALTMLPIGTSSALASGSRTVTLQRRSIGASGSVMRK
jgi:hypothetical protein